MLGIRVNAAADQRYTVRFNRSEFGCDWCRQDRTSCRFTACLGRISTLVPTELAAVQSGRSSQMVATELAATTNQAQKVQKLSAWTTDSRKPPAVVVMSPHTAALTQTGRNPAARSTAATASTSATPATASSVFCRAVCNQAGATNFSITIATRLSMGKSSSQWGRKNRHPGTPQASLVQSTVVVSGAGRTAAATADIFAARIVTIVTSLSRPGPATTF